MEFSLSKSLEIIGSTPTVLYAMVASLSDEWVNMNEGENTWTVKEVVAHLVVCEETNWMPRLRIMLSDSSDKSLKSIDMNRQFDVAKENSLQELLQRFNQLRKDSVEELKAYHLQDKDFSKTAIHPVIGEVNLQQLISTWTAHDLTHIAQIARVLAKQNKELVGGFERYLKILSA
ncbi:MAG: DinB family protein [Bacteroidetes bacterium]|nr:DinB family protein [Bacteroidota bacterium]